MRSMLSQTAGFVSFCWKIFHYICVFLLMLVLVLKFCNLKSIFIFYLDSVSHSFQCDINFFFLSLFNQLLTFNTTCYLLILDFFLTLLPLASVTYFNIQAVWSLVPTTLTCVRRENYLHCCFPLKQLLLKDGHWDHFKGLRSQKPFYNNIKMLFALLYSHFLISVQWNFPRGYMVYMISSS